MAGWAYRARQALAALRAAPTPAELSAAGQVLSPSQMALFSRMQPSEQAHSLNVARTLLSQGETDSDLLAAALLHDAGKSRAPLRLWERVVIVLAQAAFPQAVRRWGRAQPAGWRRAFAVAEQHPAWGAEMAQQAGASPITVALIRRHQTAPAPGDAPAFVRLLEKLQAADGKN